MKSEIYLDNSATTAVYPQVVELMSRIMLDDYGNPSSKHNKGVEAEHYVTQAKETLASILKCDKKEILFTSGGTESDNMALIGCAMANKRRGSHIITTMIEHPAVLETTVFLEKNGFEVTYLPVDSTGCVKLEALREALRPETILVSMMYANNEVSAVEPVAEAAQIVKAYNPEIIFHTDAVQAFGKYRIIPKRENIDLMSVSSHKLHGPKGVGFLYIKDKTRINPIIFGGGQQKGMRSGTENVPGIVGYGVAAARANASMKERTDKEIAIRDHLIHRIETEIPYVKVNGDLIKRLPNNVNVSFQFVEGESLLLMLDNYGICASSGSACTSGSLDPSHVLLAIGLPHEIAHGSLRMTLSEETTMEDVDFVVDRLKEIVAHLRSMSPLYEDFMKKQNK